MQQANVSIARSFGYSIGISILAGGLGFGAGFVTTRLAPEKFSWVGLAMVPLWFVLEVFFEVVAGVSGYRSKAARIASTSAVVLGFYVAWFALRGIAP